MLPFSHIPCVSRTAEHAESHGMVVVASIRHAGVRKPLHREQFQIRYTRADIIDSSFTARTWQVNIGLKPTFIRAYLS